MGEAVWGGSLCGSSEPRRKAEPDARCGGAGRPPDAGGRRGFVGAAFAQAFFSISVRITGACAFGGFRVAWGRAEQCVQRFVATIGRSYSESWEAEPRHGCVGQQL